MCGIVGIFGHPEASTLAYLSLYALQHRGQESAGIVTTDGDTLIRHADMGLVADVFSRDVLSSLRGSSAEDLEVIRSLARRFACSSHLP